MLGCWRIFGAVARGVSWLISSGVLITSSRQPRPTAMTTIRQLPAMGNFCTLDLREARRAWGLQCC